MTPSYSPIWWDPDAAASFPHVASPGWSFFMKQSRVSERKMTPWTGKAAISVDPLPGLSSNYMQVLIYAFLVKLELMS